MRNGKVLRRLAFGAAVAVVLWSAAAFYSAARHYRAQHDIKHSWSGPAQPTEYPVVLSHRLSDRRGDLRIVMLHKLTRPPTSQMANPFGWINLLAKNPEDGRLECKINGQDVTIDPDVLQVFFAHDDDPPTRRIYAAHNLTRLDSPETLWEQLVEHGPGGS